MAIDKKQIALTVGGILAGLTLTYLLYRLEQNNAATSAANEAQAAEDASSAQAVSASQLASLPTVSIPTISSTPTVSSTASAPTDTDSTAPAGDSGLYAFLTQLLSSDSTSVTDQQSNHSSVVSPIAALPITTIPIADPSVPIPTLDFSSSNTQQPVHGQGFTSTAPTVNTGVHNPLRSFNASLASS